MPRRYRSGQDMVSAAVRVQRVRTSGVSHESCCCCDADVCNVVQPKPARGWYPHNYISRQHGAPLQQWQAFKYRNAAHLTWLQA